MSEINAIPQNECVEAINLVSNYFTAFSFVLAFFALLLGFIVGRSAENRRLYNLSKIQETENYCPCCDYPVSEVNKGRGI